MHDRGLFSGLLHARVRFALQISQFTIHDLVMAVMGGVAGLCPFSEALMTRFESVESCNG